SRPHQTTKRAAKL
ncbi:hypothetical protein MTO96_043993, partial [Rhipicephalus appendiculatus]